MDWYNCHMHQFTKNNKIYRQEADDLFNFKGTKIIDYKKPGFND